jgi:acetyl-CoA synthetase
VESVLVSHAAVSEAAAIGVPDELKGEALVCFCVLKQSSSSAALRSEASSGGASSNLESLRQELTARIIHELGKPLAPREVKFVRDLPKTRNAKLMRRVIRAAFLGQELGDVTSLENPAAVEEIQRAS